MTPAAIISTCPPTCCCHPTLPCAVWHRAGPSYPLKLPRSKILLTREKRWTEVSAPAVPVTSGCRKQERPPQHRHKARWNCSSPAVSPISAAMVIYRPHPALARKTTCSSERDARRECQEKSNSKSSKYQLRCAVGILGSGCSIQIFAQHFPTVCWQRVQDQSRRFHAKKRYYSRQ